MVGMWIGVDNNMRADFFGDSGDTTWNARRLKEKYRNYTHLDIDIRSRQELKKLIAAVKPTAVVHTAAQPSHDLAASRPFDDFDVNAVGTLNMLEALRAYSTEVPFVHMSTNKVYEMHQIILTLSNLTPDASAAFRPARFHPFPKARSKPPCIRRRPILFTTS